VGFVYPGTGRPVFEDLELQLAPGEHSLLVGPNGAGKSTLVRLLLRLCDPTTGTVAAADVDLRAVGSAAWQRRCSVLFQDAVPFDLTVRENVTCSDPERGDEAALWHALALVGLAERVRALPQQLDTLLGRRLGEGAELSAGEWRRLLLARAIYRRAELYIVDEATAFLDREGVAQVLPALAAHWRGATVLWIDHRDALAPFVQRTIEWRSICRAR
jgi:ABC-type multidrug transport system fused ATPase/permease subunit